MGCGNSNDASIDGSGPSGSQGKRTPSGGALSGTSSGNTRSTATVATSGESKYLPLDLKEYALRAQKDEERGGGGRKAATRNEGHKHSGGAEHHPSSYATDLDSLPVLVPAEVTTYHDGLSLVTRTVSGDFTSSQDGVFNNSSTSIRKSPGGGLANRGGGGGGGGGGGSSPFSSSPMTPSGQSAMVLLQAPGGATRGATQSSCPLSSLTEPPHLIRSSSAPHPKQGTTPVLDDDTSITSDRPPGFPSINAVSVAAKSTSAGSDSDDNEPPRSPRVLNQGDTASGGITDGPRICPPFLKEEEDDEMCIVFMTAPNSPILLPNTTTPDPTASPQFEGSWAENPLNSLATPLPFTPSKQSVGHSSGADSQESHPSSTAITIEVPGLRGSNNSNHHPHQAQGGVQRSITSPPPLGEVPDSLIHLLDEVPGHMMASGCPLAVTPPHHHHNPPQHRTVRNGSMSCHSSSFGGSRSGASNYLTPGVPGGAFFTCSEMGASTAHSVATSNGGFVRAGGSATVFFTTTQDEADEMEDEKHEVSGNNIGDCVADLEDHRSWCTEDSVADVADEPGPISEAINRVARTGQAKFRVATDSEFSVVAKRLAARESRKRRNYCTKNTTDAIQRWAARCTQPQAVKIARKDLPMLEHVVSNRGKQAARTMPVLTASLGNSINSTGQLSSGQLSSGQHSQFNVESLPQVPERTF